MLLELNSTSVHPGHNKIKDASITESCFFYIFPYFFFNFFACFKAEETILFAFSLFFSSFSRSLAVDINSFDLSLRFKITSPPLLAID